MILFLGFLIFIILLFTVPIIVLVLYLEYKLRQICKDLDKDDIPLGS